MEGKTMETRTNTLKRIAGKSVQVEAHYDGIQRAEWLSDGLGKSYGHFHTGRYMAGVRAFKGDEQRIFTVAAFGSKAKSLTAAREWICR